MNANLISWLLGHVDEAAQLAALTPAILAATNLSERWEAIKPVGDVLVTIIDDFPGFTFAASADLEQLASFEVEAGAKRINWQNLLNFAKEILPILLSLLLAEKK